MIFIYSFSIYDIYTINLIFHNWMTFLINKNKFFCFYHRRIYCVKKSRNYLNNNYIARETPRAKLSEVKTKLFRCSYMEG